MTSALPDDGFAPLEEDPRDGGAAVDKRPRAEKKNKGAGRGCLIAVVIFIALMLLGRFACQQAVASLFVEDPAVVMARAQGLSAFTLPAEYHAFRAASVPKLGQFYLFVRESPSELEPGMLVLAQVQVELDRENLVKEMSSVAQEMGQGGSQDQQGELSVAQECNIGEQTGLCFSVLMNKQEATDDASGQALRWELALLKQGSRTFIASMAGDDENFSQDEWQAFLASLAPVE